MIGTPRTGGRTTLSLAEMRRRTAWLFLSPMLAALLLVAAWPLARTLWFSFTDALLSQPGPARFVGVENYRGLLADPQWWGSVANTLVFTVGSVTIEAAMGLAIALALDARFRFRGALRAAMLIPWAIPTVVSARMWSWMFHDLYGVVNAMLLWVGVISAPIAWTADPTLAMVALIAVDVWKATPFVAVLLLAALQSLPPGIHEAARVDGANRWQAFLFITLPLIAPALGVAVVFRLLDALRVFDVVYVLTGNAPHTMSMSVFARQQLIDFQDVGYGSAAATLIFMVIAVVTAVYVTLTRLSLKVER